jgi:DNA-binding CsgD family transcriptional regulator
MPKLLTEDDWSQFRVIFDKVHPGFFNRLREQFYDLTPAETRLMALTHLNLGTREIASMLGVSDQTVYKTRQRLRAKIGMSAEKGLDDLELNAV